LFIKVIIQIHGGGEILRADRRIDSRFFVVFGGTDQHIFGILTILIRELKVTFIHQMQDHLLPLIIGWIPDRHRVLADCDDQISV